MTKKILYIDMDGVVADFIGRIRKLDPTIDTMEESKRDDRVDEICQNNKHIFLDLLPIHGSTTAIKELFKVYDVYFLSTPMDELVESFTDKRIWLQYIFGDRAKKRLILTHKKDLQIGDYLVDDRFKNGAGEFKGKHIHFGSDEFPDWGAVYKYLIDQLSVNSTPAPTISDMKNHVQDRINYLVEWDKELCEDRWNPAKAKNERLTAREMSNQITFARQELQTVLRYIDKQ